MAEHKNRRAHWLWLIVALSCLNLAPGPPVLVDGEMPHAPLSAIQVRQLVGARQTPSLRASAAILADAATGQVLYHQDADAPRPPASTTKIMTALLALERAPLTDTVRIPAGLRVPGTSAHLQAGETFTLEELLYGLLLPSGNDAAVVLAQHLSGSEADFVAAMNARAAELGLTQTRFVNPHGLDAPGHVSSAADLLTLARAALRLPAFARIVATPVYQARGHTWQNRNELLASYAGADGVKTGTTEAAGECLVASASRAGHRLIAVVLGSTDRYTAAAALLDYGFAHYTWVQLDLPPGDFSRARTADGSWVPLGVYDAPWIVLPRWQREHCHSFLHLSEPLLAPGRTTPAGIQEFTLAGQRLYSQPVFVMMREAPP